MIFVYVTKMSCKYKANMALIDKRPRDDPVSYSQHRPPGIYKQDYLDELFKRYGEAEDTPEAPPLPPWHTGKAVPIEQFSFMVSRS